MIHIANYIKDCLVKYSWTVHARKHDIFDSCLFKYDMYMYSSLNCLISYLFFLFILIRI